MVSHGRPPPAARRSALALRRCLAQLEGLDKTSENRYVSDFPMEKK